jgi:hypothetical protein
MSLHICLFVSLQGVDPRTVQPVASRYTDWATGPTAWIKRKPYHVLS